MFNQRTLYDFNRLKSRFDSKFHTKIDLNAVKIDSLRGICTPQALQRLNKIAKITKKQDIYKVGSSGICLKVKKIHNKDAFSVEFFAIAQHYNLSAFAKKQHKTILCYLLNKKSFNFTQIDICLDSLKPIELVESQHTSYYKDTQYRDFGDCKMCVYRKDAKQDSLKPKKKGLIRYELTAPLTLKLAKNKQKAKPTKPRAARECKTSQPLNKNIYNNINYILNINKSKLKFKNTRDFMRKLDTS